MDLLEDAYDNARRIRRWRRIWHTRLFFAVGCILLAYSWLTLMPALWWSDISRNTALALTIWFMIAQGVVLRWLWHWLGPLMRGKREQSIAGKL